MYVSLGRTFLKKTSHFKIFTQVPNFHRKYNRPKYEFFFIIIEIIVIYKVIKIIHLGQGIIILS